MVALPTSLVMIFIAAFFMAAGAVFALMISLLVKIVGFNKYPIRVPILRERAQGQFIIGYDTAGRFRKKDKTYVYRCKKLGIEFTMEDPSFQYLGSFIGGLLERFMCYSTVALLEQTSGGERLYKPCHIKIEGNEITVEPTSRSAMLDKLSNDAYIKAYHDVDKNAKLGKMIAIGFIIFIVIALIIIGIMKGPEIMASLKGATGNIL